MPLRALSFDFDGSLSNHRYRNSDLKDIVACNLNFLDNIKEENKGFSKTFVLDGSLRQSKALDDYLSLRNHTGSCFLALTQIATYLNTTLCPILLADIFGDLSIGTSYDRIINNDSDRKHAVCLHDTTKLTLLYSQLHYLANTYPLEEIVFDFFDDRKNILHDLTVFFQKYTQMIPRNICLHLNEYNENILNSYATINGTRDTADTAYRQTIIDMIEVTPAGNSARRCTDAVCPDTLNAHRLLSTLNELCSHSITSKTTILQQEISDKQLKYTTELSPNPDANQIQTLAYLKDHIPQNMIKYEYITHTMLKKLHSFYPETISIETMETLLKINNFNKNKERKNSCMVKPIDTQLHSASSGEQTTQQPTPTRDNTSNTNAAFFFSTSSKNGLNDTSHSVKKVIQDPLLNPEYSL